MGYVKNVKGTNYWRNRVAKVCKDFPEFKCAVSNKVDFQHEMAEFGYEYVSGSASVIAARDASGQKFKMNDELSVDNFHAFMTDLKAGDLEPYLKSEAIPDNEGKGVKVAVAKNFDELVKEREGRAGRILRPVVRPLQEADSCLRRTRRKDGRRRRGDCQNGRHGQRRAAAVQRARLPHPVLAA